MLNIRRLSLDVDKARAHPSLIELAEAIGTADGVEAFLISVTEIDLETVGMDGRSKAAPSTKERTSCEYS